MTTRRTPIITRSLAAAGLVATAALSGCAQPTPAAAPITIAATATAHESAPTLNDAALGTVKEYAEQAQEPGDASVTILAQGQQPTSVDLTPMRGTKVEAISTKKEKKITERLGALGGALGQLRAGTPGLDALGVYDQALQNTPAGGTVIMITSGISTTDPVALPKAGDWINDPAAFAKLIAKQDIPDASGRHIIWVGLGYGDPQGKQPTAGPAARKAIRTIWTSICQRSGAASCTIADGPSGTAAPTAEESVPVVSFDQIATHCIGQTTLSSDVAFAPDKATLLPEADTVLRPLAQGLKDCPAGRVINAAGHTAEVPGGGNGMTLSTQRATAVLTRLRQLGAPSHTIGTATGYGDTRPRVDNTPAGVYEESLAVRNRVVELTITG